MQPQRCVCLEQVVAQTAWLEASLGALHPSFLPGSLPALAPGLPTRCDRSDVTASPVGPALWREDRICGPGQARFAVRKASSWPPISRALFGFVLKPCQEELGRYFQLSFLGCLLITRVLCMQSKSCSTPERSVFPNPSTPVSILSTTHDGERQVASVETELQRNEGAFLVRVAKSLSGKSP